MFEFRGLGLWGLQNALQRYELFYPVPPDTEKVLDPKGNICAFYPVVFGNMSLYRGYTATSAALYVCEELVYTTYSWDNNRWEIQGSDARKAVRAEFKKFKAVYELLMVGLMSPVQQREAKILECLSGNNN